MNPGAHGPSPYKRGLVRRAKTCHLALLIKRLWLPFRIHRLVLIIGSCMNNSVARQRGLSHGDSQQTMSRLVRHHGTSSLLMPPRHLIPPRLVRRPIPIPHKHHLVMLANSLGKPLVLRDHHPPSQRHLPFRPVQYKLPRSVSTAPPTKANTKNTKEPARGEKLTVSETLTSITLPNPPPSP